MFKAILASLIFTGALAQAREFHSWKEACSAASAAVSEGDLIFLDIPNPLFRRVAESTKSWTSHVGVAFKNSRGEWIVAESTIPLATETELCDYLKGSSDYMFEIRRFHRPLSSGEIERMRVAASAMLGRLYDLGFDFDSSRLFCSKLARLVYQAVGVEAGTVESFRQLLAKNPGASLDFWRVWFLGSIPWERRTVTPASLLEDSHFFTVLKGERNEI